MKNRKGIIILILLTIALIASAIYFSRLLSVEEIPLVQVERNVTNNSEGLLLSKLDGADDIYSSLIDNNLNEIDVDSISKYKIEASLDEKSMTLNAKQTIEYTNTENVNLETIELHVFTNAFKRKETSPTTLSSMSYAYPNGFSEGNTSFTSIKVNGEDVKFTLLGKDETRLMIALNKSVEMSNSITIEMLYDVKIPNCRDRFGYDDKTIQIANWYPTIAVYENGAWNENLYYSIGDPFYTETASYEVLIDVPIDYIVASTGVKEDIYIKNSDRKIYKIASDFTRDFALVMSKYFQIESKIVDGTRISTYTYTNDSDDINEALESGERTIISFNEMFGKYPYTDLAIVETSFPSGMEYPGLIMIGNSYYQDGSEESLDGVVNHEIGHQWWYSLVGNNQITESWLDEGLTSYSETLYYEYFDQRNYELEAENMKNSVTARDKKYDDLRVVKHLSEFEDWVDYGYLVYRKSQMFFINYREKYGEEKLIEALQKHFEKNKFGVTTTKDIIQTFEEVAGEEIGDIVNTSLYGEQ